MLTAKTMSSCWSRLACGRAAGGAARGYYHSNGGHAAWAVKEPGMFVRAREGESFEELYRRFKRGIEASGLLREYRRKQRFIPAHEERRDKIRSAARKKGRAMAKRGGGDR